jgi:Acetyltransferase (GNAT) domain
MQPAACRPLDPVTPSLDRMRLTIDTENAYTLSRLQVLERIPGNPVGIAYKQLDDGVVARMARHLPVTDFNSVVGLRAGHEHHLAALDAWYRENQVKARFEIVPGDYAAGLGRELTRLGYYQSDFHTSLICAPDLAGPSASSIAVEPVTDGDRMEDYLTAYVAGWGFSDPQTFKANVRPWLHEPGWSLYLARVDGRPAAAATLYVRNKVGYCADAATDPAFRSRGLHGALLITRIHAANAAGVDFVCSGAKFLSPSHRNMERVGMRIQFVRAIWTAL